MQKLRSLLLRIQSCAQMVLSVKPQVSRNIALHAWPTARNSAFVMLTFPVHSTSLFFLSGKMTCVENNESYLIFRWDMFCQDMVFTLDWMLSILSNWLPFSSLPLLHLLLHLMSSIFLILNLLCASSFDLRWSGTLNWFDCWFVLLQFKQYGWNVPSSDSYFRVTCECWDSWFGVECDCFLLWVWVFLALLYDSHFWVKCGCFGIHGLELSVNVFWFSLWLQNVLLPLASGVCSTTAPRVQQGLWSDGEWATGCIGSVTLAMIMVAMMTVTTTGWCW